MAFEWDEAKAASNLAKHGVSFEIAYGFDWDGAIIVVDGRNDYGEERSVAHGRGADGNMYVVAFTLRGAAIRIISLRRFGRKEYKLYGD